jgi:hypothetical protein
MAQTEISNEFLKNWSKGPLVNGIGLIRDVNHKYETVYEWITAKLTSSYNEELYHYEIPHYGDYICNFQIINPSNHSVTVLLECNGKPIGKYELNPGVNNIQPVWGTPGLMVSAMGYCSIFINSPIEVTVNLLAVEAFNDNPCYVKKTKQPFNFVGPQGDEFHCSEGIVSLVEPSNETKFISIIDMLESKDNRMEQHPIARLMLNTKFNIGYGWQKLSYEDKGSNIYNIPKYGDYISSFQIISHSEKDSTVQLRAYDRVFNNGTFHTIGTYTLTNGVNNIIPTVGTPGLMNCAMPNISFWLECDDDIDVSALNAFCSNKSPCYFKTVQNTTIEFGSTQGDLFMYGENGLELKKYD